MSVMIMLMTMVMIMLMTMIMSMAVIMIMLMLMVIASLCSQHDDAELKRVGDAYSSGAIASGEIKARSDRPPLVRESLARRVPVLSGGT